MTNTEPANMRQNNPATSSGEAGGLKLLVMSRLRTGVAFSLVWWKAIPDTHKTGSRSPCGAIYNLLLMACSGRFSLCETIATLQTTSDSTDIVDHIVRGHSSVSLMC